MSKWMFNESTLWKNIFKEAEESLDNPLIIKVNDEDIKIYNFNSHPIDFKALLKFARTTPYNKTFVIPHAMSGAWYFIYDKIREIAKEKNIDLDNAVFLNYRNKKYLPVFSPYYSIGIFKAMKETKE